MNQDSKYSPEWIAILEKRYGIGCTDGNPAQAYCAGCGVRHTWPRKLGPRVAAAVCPNCQLPMRRTTNMIQAPVEYWAHGLGVQS